MKNLCPIFRGIYRLSGTGIVECLKIIVVGCNLKQFDVETDRKCIFLFSAVDENAVENEILFSAEKRKRKSHVPLSQNLVTVCCEHNIFGRTQMKFLNENEN